MTRLSDRSSERVLLAAIAVVVAVLVSTIQFRLFADDVWFRDVLTSGAHDGLLGYISFRFEHWSSRVVIEAVLVTVVQAPWLWKLVTAVAFFVVITVPPRFLARTPAARVPLTLASAAVTAAIPLGLVFETGYVATTTNYLWPLAAGLLAAWPAVDRLNQVRTRPPVYVVAALGLVYAAGSELVAAILFFEYAVTLGVELRRGRPAKALLPYAAGALLGVVVALAAPGNARRAEQEIATWFPTYGDLGLLRRAEMGYSSTLRSTFLSGYLLPLVFFAVLLALVLVRRLGTLWSVVAAVPLFAGVLLGLNPGSRVTSWFAGQFTQYGLMAADRPGSWVAFLALTVFLACLTAAVAVAFTRPSRAVATLLVVYVGFFTRFILGFSPTVWASGDRTDTFLLFAFGLGTLMVLVELARVQRPAEAVLRP